MEKPLANVFLARKIARRVGRDPNDFESFCSSLIPHFHHQGNFTVCVIPISSDLIPVPSDLFAVGVTKRRPIAVKRFHGARKKLGDEHDKVTAEMIALARAYRDLSGKMV